MSDVADANLLSTPRLLQTYARQGPGCGLATKPAEEPISSIFFIVASCVRCCEDMFIGLSLKISVFLSPLFQSFSFNLTILYKI
jgi:hypothetical protein